MLKVCDSIKRGGVVASLLAAGLATSACVTEGAAGDPSNKSAADPIAAVTTANGTTVSFFEPSPGTLAIGQEVALGVAPVASAGMSAVELYRSLAPGQAVPQDLVDAQARAADARIGRPLVPSAPKASSVAGTSDFSSAWFEDNHCYEDDGVGWHFINCHASPLPTSTLSGTHGDIDEFRVDACANTASITLRVWVESDQRVGVQLTPGHCYAYHWWSGLFNADSFKSSATVTDSGNYGLAVKWNQ